MNEKSKITKPILRKEIVHPEKTLSYELREYDSKDIASFKIPLYEISIVMKNCDVISYCRSGALFSSLRKALAFFDMLTECTATPLDLPYVIEDSLSF